ncbi:MAG: M20/M25/M40 family metallo-hydrolase [Gemmatimonadetes bacterium]|nr:M20/M25/M40 family metallo-hydrolase [Gemmatimonadota bacterium]
MELTTQLISIPSVTGSEGTVVTAVALLLAELGWSVQRQPLDGDRANLYATRGEPVVVLSTHLDTVPPFLPAREADGILHGRGSCDAKGLAAAMIVAAERLAAEGEDRVGLLFVVGEENGSDGALAAATLAPKGRILINGEPTGNRLATAQKGALRVSVEARGVAAHSGYPELGRSAIDLLLDALQRIRAIEWPVDPQLGPSTLNIGRIVGGEAPNVMAPSARAELMVRLVGPGAPIRAAILAAAGPDVAVTFPLEVPALRSPSLPGWEEITVAFASDLPLLSAWGTGYQLGPGTIHVAHTDHEQITVAELRAGVDRYVTLVRTLLARAVR